jgi:hypothetical protein
MLFIGICRSRLRNPRFDQQDRSECWGIRICNYFCSITEVSCTAERWSTRTDRRWGSTIEAKYIAVDYTPSHSRRYSRSACSPEGSIFSCICSRTLSSPRICLRRIAEAHFCTCSRRRGIRSTLSEGFDNHSFRHTRTDMCLGCNASLPYYCNHSSQSHPDSRYR